MCREGNHLGHMESVKAQFPVLQRKQPSKNSTEPIINKSFFD